MLKKEEAPRNDDINSALLDALTKYGQRENICLKKNLKEGWDK